MNLSFILQCCWTNLLSDYLLVDSLGFSIHNIICKYIWLSFFFSKWILKKKKTFLIALTWTSSTKLNRSWRESGHSCLIPELRRKVLSLSPWSMLVMRLLKMPFIKLRKSHLLLIICCIFSSWGTVKFCQIFFCIYWDAHVVFVLYSIDMLYYIDSWMLNQP